MILLLVLVVKRGAWCVSVDVARCCGGGGGSSSSSRAVLAVNEGEDGCDGETSVWPEECESDDQRDFIGASAATRGGARMQPCLSLGVWESGRLEQEGTSIGTVRSSSSLVGGSLQAVLRSTS